jgi:hypothetical protein
MLARSSGASMVSKIMQTNLGQGATQWSQRRRCHLGTDRSGAENPFEGQVLHFGELRRGNLILFLKRSKPQITDCWCNITVKGTISSKIP